MPYYKYTATFEDNTQSDENHFYMDEEYIKEKGGFNGSWFKNDKQKYFKKPIKSFKVLKITDLKEINKAFPADY